MTALGSAVAASASNRQPVRRRGGVTKWHLHFGRAAKHKSGSPASASRAVFECARHFTALRLDAENVEGRRECGTQGAARAQIVLLLLSASVAVALGADSDPADTAGAATPTERCGAQRTTSGIGVHGSRTLSDGLPEWDPALSDDPGGCSPRQAVTDQGRPYLPRTKARGQHPRILISMVLGRSRAVGSAVRRGIRRLLGGQGRTWVLGEYGTDAGVSTGYRALTPKQVREWTASLDEQDAGVATAPGLADTLFTERLNAERARREHLAEHPESPAQEDD